MVGTLTERRQSAGPLKEIFPQTLLDALPLADPQQQSETSEGHRLNLKLELFEDSDHRSEAFPVA